jgi:hypothetical protein
MFRTNAARAITNEATGTIEVRSGLHTFHTYLPLFSPLDNDGNASLLIFELLY